MRRSFTAVIERNRAITADFATEPYEAGWASEARWFVRVFDVLDNTSLTLIPQISPDGLIWCDEGTPPLQIKSVGLYSFALHDFGQWLRLQGQVSGSEPGIKVMIYLALKE